MSDDIEVEVPVEDPDAVGQVEDVDGGAEEFEVTELDIEQFRNHQVRITVDGEEVVVPLSEALAGYSRQADYTRKTQELAAQRAEIQWATAFKAALANDPEGTISLIADHYGISRAEARQMANDDPWGDDTGTSADPKVSELEKRLARFEQQEADRALQNEISRLQSKYGEDFDPGEVVAAALAAGSNDLESTFKTIAFDRLVAKQQKTAAKTAATEAAKEAKRAASVVAGGASAKGAPEPEPIRSISDAYRLAKRELGVS